MRQPSGARQLIALRAARKRPLAVVVTDDRVIAQLAVHLFGYFALVAGAGAWDMRSVHRLPVIVWCWTPDMLGLLASIDECRPESLAVIDRERETVIFDRAEAIFRSHGNA